MHLARGYKTFFSFIKCVFRLYILCGLCSKTCFAELDIDTGKMVYSVETVLGTSVNLPCDITPPEAKDKMHILIWYKDKVPIYTFDSRGKKLEQGKHWSIESLSDRTGFKFQDDVAKLSLSNARESDEGSYQCRVDFRRSPTRNVLVNVTVIIPPEKVIILNEKGVQIPHYILGPYNEGETINITCVATGGRPLPKVTWWQENALLDGSYDYLSERKVQNVLHIKRLERKDLHTVFTCQASNNNLIAPISSSVTLDMNLRPLWVKLLGKNKPLSADNTYELSCQVVGSRPSPTITWWKGGVQITDTRETTSPDSNATTSVLTFTPSADDGGKYLSCKGQQSLILSSAIEDGWRLEIYHVPVVTLELGSNLNALTIREGSDVYFECNIKSNPWVYKVSWRHNGQMLYNNGASGTIVSNQSLVLQSISKARAGSYTCIGSNREGDGESNVVKLDVKFAPICKSGQQRVYNVARHEGVSINCEVEANPTNTQFVWKFNNSDNQALVLDMPQSLITTNKTTSKLFYTPMTEHDYGTLLCKGVNNIGIQKEPCVFYINPAGKPDPLSNCTVVNQTGDSVQVACVEGFNGGLQQTFVLEVYDFYLDKLISNISSNRPEFFAGGLKSGRKLNLIIYASNKKGRSELRSVQTATLKSLEEFTAIANPFQQLTPILGALIGLVLTLILIATVIVIIIRVRGGEEDDKNYNRSIADSGSVLLNGTSKNTSSELLRTEVNSSVNSLEEKNPDIIPHNNADDEYLEEERAFEALGTPQTRTYLRIPAPTLQGEPNFVKTDPQSVSHKYHTIQREPSQQPFSSPRSLQRMPLYHQLPAYIPRHATENQYDYDTYISSATPLISRENNRLYIFHK
ncbi:hypothetical protein PPYR_02628 [Photinus pyralis]|uniref:Ig-like domain-containing protein n=1 Tax=Photinus pyralis TaxID=7054 RepID=A0A5N4B7Y1_PHOPY|nr:hypothetical protein PPYR_02628 [Photinus pyralis]